MKNSSPFSIDKLYSAIVNYSADAIFFVDEANIIRSWNRGAELLFGYRPEEIIGKSQDVLLPAILRELGESEYIRSELERKGFIQQYETRRLHRSGKEIFVELTQTRIYDEQGNPVGSSVILRDVTERKQLELELRQSVRELSLLSELNEVLMDIYHPDEIIRTVLLALISGEKPRFDRAAFFAREAGEGVLVGKLAVGPVPEAADIQRWKKLQTGRGSLREVLAVYHRHFRRGSYPFEKQIQKIQISLSAVSNVLIHALQKNKILIISPELRDGAEGLHFRFDGYDLRDALQTSSFVVLPLITKKRNFGVIWADNRISGRVIGPEEVETLKVLARQAVLMLENVQLYRNLEERVNELQQAYRKLEEHSLRLVRAEKLAALGEMASRVAHEIRNPLVSIGGFANLLEKKLSPDSPLRQYAGIIKSQVGNLEAILDNILNLAHPRKPEKKRVDVHQILHQVLMMMDALIRSRKIRVQLQFNCQDSWVSGDEKLLYQAFFNIVKNSLDAMGEGGVLTLKSNCDTRQMHVQIIDTGVGIPREQLIKIYDPFFTTKPDGTGLGLAIVHQIIRDHGGMIQFESELGKGTTAHIFLPRQQKKGQEE